MKAVVMCGGKGSRLKPLTENIPKPLVKIMNRPVLDIIIEKLISSGIDNISLSLGYKASDIIEYCESRNYSAEISYVVENEPLGTAGGVKKCINRTDDDILVLSGDNVFDFDLTDAFDFHKSSEADFTLCASKTEDPREYGVVITDDDGSITSFIEKPTWEQSESFIVNTGIYLFSGSILDRIPEDTFFDFSKDLFPGFFKDNIRFMCYPIQGFWGDMGEFESMLRITRELFMTENRRISFSGTFYGKDTLLENGALIKAPCLIDKKTVIGENAEIGPFTVIGENCIISEKTAVISSVIGNNCSVGIDTEIKNAILADDVRICDNCIIESHSVVGSGCRIGRFARVSEGRKIWPHNKIPDGDIVHKDILCHSSYRAGFDVFGMSAKLNSEFSLVDAAELGLAIASVEKTEKIGIAFDGKRISENFKNVFLAAFSAAGKCGYDFGEAFISQSYFYSSYCALDFFIYVGTEDERINISFFGKFAMPVSSVVSRQINNNFKYRSFDYCSSDSCNEIFNMKLFSVVYKSYFRKISENASEKFNINIECENPIMKKFLKEVFEESNNTEKLPKLIVLFNKSGSEMFVVENERFYSCDQILALLCEIEMADGRNVIVPEDAADFLEETAEKYDCRVFRVYESQNPENEFESVDILNCIWAFDRVMLLGKLLNILEKTKVTIKELFEFRKNFAIKKSEIEIRGNPGSLKKLIMSTGAEKNDNGVYYVYENRKGKVRLRQMGNSGKIRMLAQSFDIESAKELCAFITQKIENSNIDKGS